MSSDIEATERLLAGQRALKEQLERDPYRPRYHFMPPGGWINDPTGAILWQGRYHLFYEYYPNAAYSVVEHEDGSHNHLPICWGHSSSADLLHWVHHPIALAPSIDEMDGNSCFSGHVVDNDGVATIIYYGRPSGSCIATADDHELNEWTKYPQAVIPAPQQGDDGYGQYGVGDPCMWREGDVWYALCGFRDPEGGDTASLFRSNDTLNWTFLHSLYTSERKWTTVDDDCAVPDFFQLGQRHMLLFMSHETGAQYYLGRWQDEHFYPETHGHMNWPGGQLNAPKSMLDAKGRRLLWGWICEGRTRAAQRAAGWASVLSLPRELSLDASGELRIAPAEELEALRFNHRKRADIHLDDGELDLPEVKGDCLELGLTMEAHGAAELGIRVRCAPDGSEQTAIVWDPSKQILAIDTRQSSLRTDILQPWPKPWATLFSDPLGMFEETRHVEVQEAPLALAPGEVLELRVFLDRSVLEVFANGRQCLTQRIYPERDDSLGTVLFSKGGQAVVKTIEAWDMEATGI